jgi:hypothetical protein
VFARVLVVGACALLALPALASAAPPPLTGTTLLGGPATDVQRSCNPSGTSTVTFTASGDAIGTYSGPYTESGTITIGPQTTPIMPLLGLSFAGPVTSIEIDFTIDSAVGDVTGTKTFATAGPFNQLCGSFSGQGGVQFGGLTNASGEASQAGGNVSYSAFIEAPDGNYNDSGSAFMNTVSMDATGTGGTGTFTQNNFFESFGASNGVVPAPAGTVRPGKGCGDKNAEHEREEECKKDPK